jgi:hypothetical protein
MAVARVQDVVSRLVYPGVRVEFGNGMPEMRCRRPVPIGACLVRGSTRRWKSRMLAVTAETNGCLPGDVTSLMTQKTVSDTPPVYVAGGSGTTGLRLAVASAEFVAPASARCFRSSSRPQ